MPYFANTIVEVREIPTKNEPIVEGYIGEYASGKSENAVNRALFLAGQGRKVTLADLDIVEPFYTLRPIKKQLESLGINVLAWETKETFGLGEAGSIIRPEMRWVLKRDGDIILDIGYGVEGSKTLNLLEGIEDNPYLKIIAVVNTSRPATHRVEDIVEYVATLGRVDAIINNTHLGEETTVDIIQAGSKVVSEAAKRLGIPIIATSAEERFRQELGEKDIVGNPIRYIRRFMPHTFW
ncbi:MAG: hypothetical protein ACOX1Y_13965 [Zhaonellaceae bacterium]|jgi:hypothetical protein|nr:hypothetical protein [Clostridia bacterium]